MTNNITKLKTIKDTIESSPAFEAALDPIQLLETLDGFIENISRNQEKVDIQAIHTELETIEIITMNYKGECNWITSPFTIQKTVEKRSMLLRIMHLLKSGGEWKGELRKRGVIEGALQTNIPLKLHVNNEVVEKALNNKSYALLVSLIGIHQIITDLLKSGKSEIAVFRKPDAVLAMNKLELWLEENNKNGDSRSKFELDVTNLSEIANNATLIV